VLPLLVTGQQHTPAPLARLQRLQRFSTYGKLKQVVLSIIAEELAGESTAQPLASITTVQVGALGSIPLQ